MPMPRMIAALGLLAASSAIAQPLALTDARIVDGTGSAPTEGQTILVEDGVIAAIFADGGQALPDGAKVIDLGGRSVLPGLIDGHVHLNVAKAREATLAALLKSGVTAVREVAGDVRISRDLAQRQQSGAIAAPKIYYSAVLYGPKFLSDPRAQGSQPGLPPGTAPWSRTVTPNDDIAQIVADARATGANAIKLYASLPAPIVAELTSEAHRQGLKVWSHSVTFPARPSEVVAAGVDSIIHSRGLIAEGRDDVPDNYAEGTQVWIRQLDFAGVDPQAPLFQRLFAQMKAQGTIFEPALHADGDPAKGPTGDWRDAMRDWSCRITGAAHRAGVAISAGTDTPAATGAVQREMGRLVDCGLSPLEAIRAATLNNAKAIGIEETHGSVEVGKVADLVVVDGDPASDIGAASDVHMVVQGGRIIGDPAN